MINTSSQIRPMRYVAPMLSFLLIILMLWSGVADAYEYDHYALTYYLALQVGFTKRQAFQIASATYALDFDPNLSPMNATAGDAIAGANHAVWGIFGNKKPELAAIWSNYHAFADEEITKRCTVDFGWESQRINPDNQCGASIMVWYPAQHMGKCPPDVFTDVEKVRQQRKDALYLLAMQQGNPGVLLHYLQDYYAHFAFDNFHGHAYAAHIPDFLSTDPPKAECAMRDSRAALEQFRDTLSSFQGAHELFLAQKPGVRDDARISQVLAQLIEINPMVGSWLPWESPTHLSPEGADRAHPLEGRTIAVIDSAILKDEQDGRLPKWPGKIDPYEALMPPDYFNYTYDPNGHITEPSDVLRLRTPGPVEQPQFKFGTLKIDTTPSTQHPGLVKVHLRLPYTIAGLAGMYDGKQNNYLTPLPVIEKNRLTDESNDTKLEQRRMNGDFAVEREVERNSQALDKTSWAVSVQLYGYEPVEKTVSLAKQAALPDCYDLLQRENENAPPGRPIITADTAQEILMNNDELAALCAGGAAFTPMQQNTCNGNLREHSLLQNPIAKTVQQCQDLCAANPSCRAYLVDTAHPYDKNSYFCQLLNCPGKFTSTYTVNQFGQRIDDPGPEAPGIRKPCDGVITADKCPAAGVGSSTGSAAGNGVEQDVGGHPR